MDTPSTSKPAMVRVSARLAAASSAPLRWAKEDEVVMVAWEADVEAGDAEGPDAEPAVLVALAPPLSALLRLASIR